MDADFWMAIGAGALMVSAVVFYMVIEYVRAGR